MSDMTPADLGLPRQFARFRSGQLDAAMLAACSERRHVMMSMPTGSGKSLVYVAAAQLMNARTLILTGTKGLQKQLLDDFAEIGLTDIRGQNNYRCAACEDGGELSEYGRPGAMCDEGPCHIGVRCSMRPNPGSGDGDGSGTVSDNECTYFAAVARAREARLVVTNYAYWMTIGRFAEPGALGDFDLLVLDEAHAAPDALADFCAIRLDKEEVKSLISMAMPVLDEGNDVWIGWARVALAECKNRQARVRTEFTQIGSDRRRLSKLLKRLADLGHGLKELTGAHEWRRSEPSDPNVIMPGMQTDWVAERTETGALFSPVWAHAYAEEYLFRAIPRVVLVSATLQPAAARYMGINPAQIDFREFASTFDPARRPLIYVPTTTVDRHMNEGQVRMWLSRIDGIVAGRLDRKGVIHTRSYERARLIVERSKHRAIMLTHTSRTTRETVERFKRAKAPCVLVSPSVEEGYDFVGDLARYQILAKVPFIDMRSALMQARIKSDKTYANYVTALALIQQTGRGMRAEDDMCETLVVDDHFAWFGRAARAFFPRWFRAAWRTETTIPPAPRLI